MNKYLAIFGILFLFFFSFGCLNSLVKFSCSFVEGKNADHCYQFGAVQTADASLCENIKGKDFSSIGSNPPKDKCYLLIANKTNDPSHCEKIQGGFYSYSKEECLINVAKNTGDPKICKKITSSDPYEGKEACLSAARTSTAYSQEKEKEEEKELEAENKKQVPKKQQEQTNQLSNKKELKDYSENLKESGLKPAEENKISSKTKEIVQNLAEKSKKEINKLSEAKDQAVAATPTIPTPPAANSKEKDKEGYLSKAWSWIGWGGEKTKDVYEGVGEKAPTSIAVVSTASKTTEAIKDVSELGQSYEKINQQVQSNQITEKQGQLLKVGYGLGKGIKWIAKNVPVVGDTVGEVADKSFESGMKFGEKLAQHTTKTNKCIDDPLLDDCID